MVKNPVIILGAGATKACGGPLTDEILPAALNGEMVNDMNSVKLDDREELLHLTWKFMTECFNVPNVHPIAKEDCPNLPMVLSMLRRSIEMGQPINHWQPDDLVKAKRAVEYSVFAVIEAALRKMRANAQFHHSLLEPLYQNGVAPVVISLNYDVIADNTMFRLAEQYSPGATPDYGVDISTPQYVNVRQRGVFGSLYKIHGSLNWLYCEKCSRLDLFVSEGLNGMQTSKALDELYHTAPFREAYSCRGTRCRNHPNCDGYVSPVLITPTYVKDYQNPHILKVWQEAESAMKKADKVAIIGYSLPSDDVEVGLLLKRGLGHLNPGKITVVEYADGEAAKAPADRIPLDRHPTGKRFRTVLGSGLDWHTTGFEGWLKEQGQAVFN